MSEEALNLADRKLLRFGKKVYDFAFRDPRLDAKFNILEGTVRSGKTWGCNVKLFRLLSYPVKGHNVIFGVTKQTIKNNVLDDVFEIVGPKNYTFNRQTGELNLMGVPWLVIGAKDEGSEKFVRGLTVGRALGDELTLQPPSFVKMMQNRLSVEGARLYATTNTDSPLHFVKTDLLDNIGLRKSGDLWSEHFTLLDNPHNAPGYKESLERMYPPGSLYHQRFVLGLWVTGEGAIYKDVWSPALMYTRKSGPKHIHDAGSIAERYVGVDCGVDHPQIYLDGIDDGKVLWVDREYRWDSSITKRQKTDKQYADDLIEFLKKAPGAQTIIPPECASFRAELIQRGVWLTDADNEVLDGIKMVSSVMGLGLVRYRVEEQCRKSTVCICGTQCCAGLVAELVTYIWDAKARLRGVEQPLKVKDDGPDAKRYMIKTKFPAWRIAAASYEGAA